MIHGQDYWNELVGEDLSGVVFVRDYLQLQFNPPPQVNVYSARVRITNGKQCSYFSEEPFANMVIALIGQVVIKVEIDEAEELRILFNYGADISISLRKSDYVGPEAVELQCRSGTIVVI